MTGLPAGLRASLPFDICTTGVVELVGGLEVLMSAFVPWVSIPLAAILLVSVFTVLLP